MAQGGRLQGTVADESGSVVPGATVVVTDAHGEEHSAKTDARGGYAFPSLPPGSYIVQASAPQLSGEGVSIEVGPEIRRLDLTLRVARLVQEVDVGADAAPVVTTDPASNAGATVIHGSDLDALSNNPDDLMSDLQALAGPSAGPGGGSIFVDGFSGAEIPPKETIREVRINQNPFAAEFDKLGLGRIEILTKPGADRWRGNVNYNFGTDWWNARNPYSPSKAPLRLHESENTVGGPVGRRASFLIDVTQHNVDNGAIVNAVTLDPATLARSPYYETYRARQRRTRVYPRLDYQLNDKNTLTFRYSFLRSDVNGTGIGGFDLASRGIHGVLTTHTYQIIETAVLNPQTVNEVRFQLYQNRFHSEPFSADTAVQVLDSFNGGGSPSGQTRDTYDSMELLDTLTKIAGTHTWRLGGRLRASMDDNLVPQNFNGTFTFSGGAGPSLDAANQIVTDSSGQPVVVTFNSIERYRRTLLFQSQGLTASAIRSLGGGATQFSIATGRPDVQTSQYDGAFFVGDDWRIRPNLTASLGLRYELQNNMSDWTNIAPRVGLAWAPGGTSKNPRSTLLIRLGFGIFYDRFALANTIDAVRYNGITQQQYTVANPDFFPNIPTPADLATLSSIKVVRQIYPNIRTPRIVQSAITVERELAKNTTLSVSYANSHGDRMLRSMDVNAPALGTYVPGIPGSGTYPLGTPGAVFQTQSTGLYNQHQMLVNVNSRLNSNVSWTASYSLNKAMSDTDGVNTFPANPYSLAGEYGPAATDVRHRVAVTGSVNTKWDVRFSPLLTIQSGPPFDITTGSDLYGTTLFNSRPGIASSPVRPGLVQTQYGLLDPAPVVGEPILPRNFGRGPGQVMVNLRVAKVIGFGAERGDVPKTPPGLRGIFTTAPGGHRYTLNISMSIRNLLNHTNPGPIIGNVTSPLFGEANRMAGGSNAEGFSENASNRKLELQVKFSF